MQTKLITEDALQKLLLELDVEQVRGLVQNDERAEFEIIDEENVQRLNLRCVRVATSIKAFLMPAKEKVAVYPNGEEAPWENIEGLPAAVVGVRACDLSAVAYLDKIFLEGDFIDPFYKARREKTIIISVDCVAASDKCFCTLIGEKPYATEGFDLNLTPTDDGYIVEAGSEMGERILADFDDLLQDAGDEHLKQRDTIRQNMLSTVREQNREFETGEALEEIVRKATAKDKWISVSVPCVECGACTNVCPTCYCFMLYDRLVDEERALSERLKIWDSCLLRDYSRMAGVGGAKPNPRPELRNRFENRFQHKFVHTYDTYKRLACVGCGRCIEACLGGIDIRAVLRELSQ